MLVLSLCCCLFSPRLKVSQRTVLSGVVCILRIRLECDLGEAVSAIDVESEVLDPIVSLAFDELLAYVELLLFYVFAAGVRTLWYSTSVSESENQMIHGLLTLRTGRSVYYILPTLKSTVLG